MTFRRLTRRTGPICRRGPPRRRGRAARARLARPVPAPARRTPRAWRGRPASSRGGCRPPSRLAGPGESEPDPWQLFAMLATVPGGLASAQGTRATSRRAAGAPAPLPEQDAPRDATAAAAAAARRCLAAHRRRGDRPGTARRRARPLRHRGLPRRRRPRGGAARRHRRRPDAAHLGRRRCADALRWGVDPGDTVLVGGARCAWAAAGAGRPAVAPAAVTRAPGDRARARLAAWPSARHCAATGRPAARPTGRPRRTRRPEPHRRSAAVVRAALIRLRRRRGRPRPRAVGAGAGLTPAATTPCAGCCWLPGPGAAASRPTARLSGRSCADREPHDEPSAPASCAHAARGQARPGGVADRRAGRPCDDPRPARPALARAGPRPLLRPRHMPASSAVAAAPAAQRRRHRPDLPPAHQPVESA